MSIKVVNLECDFRYFQTSKWIADTISKSKYLSLTTSLRFHMTSQIVAIILTFQFFISSSFAQKPFAPNFIYSESELKADLKYLKTKLESKHPGLQLKTSKSNMY